MRKPVWGTLTSLRWVLAGTGTFLSLMSSFSSIPAALGGTPGGEPGSWQNSTAPSSEIQEPTEVACQDSSFFRPSSSEHPFPDVLFSGKESKQSCVAPHGKSKYGTPAPILGFNLCRLVRKLLLLKFFQLHLQGPVPVNIAKFQKNF